MKLAIRFSNCRLKEEEKREKERGGGKNK